jgi:hypothetical protein
MMRLTRTQIVHTFAKSLHAIWYFCMGVALVSFVLVGVERDLELREELDTEYRIRELEKNRTPDAESKPGEEAAS